ncbi:S8 family peptidase [Erysipelothrix rhusiopathiae]|nr:S8 family peptidase [Erysipelothrix rhusiopathiae]
MTDKNLPIKLVLQRETDSIRNIGGGDTKFFGEFTPELKDEIANKFKNILEYYSDVFSENPLVPAIGKIKVKQEAIAKSHKPNELCKSCRIIGGEDLDEIYIKVSKQAILETIESIKEPSSKKLKANMTTIEDIQPIQPDDKISSSLQDFFEKNDYHLIKDKIKVKVFDFDDNFDNSQIEEYVFQKLEQFGLKEYDIISYGNHIRYIKLHTNSRDDISKIASINGIKSIDFFQDYSLPMSELNDTELKALLDYEDIHTKTNIGIIDGGISTDNEFLSPYIIHREVYVEELYQNPSHATFIASMIQYGNVLNNISSNAQPKFNFVDVVAVPNSDPNYGPTDSINEEDLMEIIEEVMEKHGKTTKIWNLSLGIQNKLCDGTISDLAVFLDYIQDTYQVQILVSSGNLNSQPLREWPPQDTIEEKDRINSPADSIRAITVGSVALFENVNSIVKTNEPSPFSRRGPGASYVVKPDVVDYGGNCTRTLDITNLGVRGLSPDGKITEGIGTSYSTPRVAQKLAVIHEEMIEKDLLLAKAMLIHSAKMHARDTLEKNQDNIKYYGFGMPNINIEDILHCSENEVTLVFKQVVPQGFHLEMFDFPYPKSLIRNGKYYGEICMTLAYNPYLDERFGMEYCRTNIDVSFGTFEYVNGKSPKFNGQVPLECNWDEKFETSRVENGFKWSPIKSYYRKLKKGIKQKDGWKIRVNMNARNNTFVANQEFVLIVTITDPDGNDIYTEIVNALREQGYATNNLETKQQVRQRQ